MSKISKWASCLFLSIAILIPSYVIYTSIDMSYEVEMSSQHRMDASEGATVSLDSVDLLPLEANSQIVELNKEKEILLSVQEVDSRFIETQSDLNENQETTNSNYIDDWSEQFNRLDISRNADSYKSYDLVSRDQTFLTSVSDKLKYEEYAPGVELNSNTDTLSHSPIDLNEQKELLIDQFTLANNGLNTRVNQSSVNGVNINSSIEGAGIEGASFLKQASDYSLLK